MIHDRRHPDTKLKTDSYDLGHIFKKYINRGSKISQSQHQHRRCKAIIDHLNPGKYRHPSCHQIHDHHNKNKKAMHQQTGDQLDHRQYLYFKNHLFDQITVFLQAACDSV